MTTHIVAAADAPEARRWVSWNWGDVWAGLFGWAVTGVCVAYQWGPVVHDGSAWSGAFVLTLGVKLLPVAVIVTVLWLLGLELGIPLWAPWRLFRARRTLTLRHAPPALIHGTGFWPVYFHRTYPRELIARVVLEVEDAEQHLKNERYADYARLALYRPGHRLPTVLLHKTRVPADILPLYRAIGEFLDRHPASPASPPGGGEPVAASPPRSLTLDEVEA